MGDIVDKKTRSKMMAGIHNKNTKPELQVRKYLFSQKFRYRLHYKKLPGSPDIALPKYQAVIFVHGCFWHGHHCHLFKIPKTRSEFWKNKINTNIRRDIANQDILLKLGWRVAIVWECALKGKQKLPPTMLINTLSEWLKTSKNNFIEINGT